MGKPVLIALLLTLFLVTSTYAAEYEKDPWSFSVDESKGILSVSHTRLGPLLTGIRLQTRQGEGLVPLTGWAVADRGAEGLAVTARAPSPATWERS